jgi:dTDP-4-dehydrorhamnose 3,5-epimerase
MHNPVPAPQTVTASGDSVALTIDGVKIFYSTTHQDDRGTLCEVYSRSWEFDDVPLVHAYLVTIRPGKVKGWAIHSEQIDRYFFVNGSVKLVLFDDRECSPTKGLVREHYFSEMNRALVSVPPGISHAVENVGQSDALMFNIPSEPYHYECPDKKLLPLENSIIPYSFSPRRGY